MAGCREMGRKPEGDGACAKDANAHDVSCRRRWDSNACTYMYFVGRAVVNFISSMAMEELRSENSTRLIRFL
ncbi:hypothetical protein D3C87_2123700 [compost metagenome]